MLFREEPFNIIQTITEAVEMFRADAARKEIQFILKISEDLPETVIGDCSKLRQVSMLFIILKDYFEFMWKFFEIHH